jgi:hypothetical protein
MSQLVGFERLWNAELNYSPKSFLGKKRDLLYRSFAMLECSILNLATKMRKHNKASHAWQSDRESGSVGSRLGLADYFHFLHVYFIVSESHHARGYYIGFSSRPNDKYGKSEVSTGAR